MIESKLGTVKLTEPNYKLCEILEISKADVDIGVRTMLIADLGAILKALELRYGLAEAMEMWVEVASIITDIHNEEKEQK